MGSQLYSQSPVVDPVSSPTSALKKKGNKVICGDSFHLGIWTVLTTRPEVQGSYEVEGSCVMFTFCMSLPGSYGFYRSTITWANGRKGLCQDYVISLLTGVMSFVIEVKSWRTGLNFGICGINKDEMHEKRARVNRRRQKMRWMGLFAVTSPNLMTHTALFLLFPFSFFKIANRDCSFFSYRSVRPLSNLSFSGVSGGKGPFLLYCIQTNKVFL